MNGVFGPYYHQNLRSYLQEKGNHQRGLGERRKAPVNLLG